MAATAICDKPSSGGPSTARGGPARPLIAWSPKGELEHPEWLLVGRRLSAIGRSSQWWIGDWLLYGARKWGEKYGEAARITGYDVGSLRNMASLASQFGPSRRRDKLTWCHHAAVASLDRDEQDYWLERSTALRLSVADLRLELRTARGARARPADGEREPSSTSVREELLCPNCGYPMSFAVPRGFASPSQDVQSP
jgi:hypothetical protein